MNAITTRPTGGAAIPETMILPPMPDRFLAHLDRCAAWDDDRVRFSAATPQEREGMLVGPPPVPPAITADERAQTAAALAAVERMMRPATLGEWAVFLAQSNAAACNPQGSEDFGIKVRAIVSKVGDTPIGALTMDTHRRIGGDFFPGPETIRKAAEPSVRRLRATHAALVMMVRDTTALQQAGGAAEGEDAARLEAEKRRHFSDPERIREAAHRARMSRRGPAALAALAASIRHWAPEPDHAALLSLLEPEREAEGAAA